MHVAVLSASLRFKPLECCSERAVTKGVLPKSHKAKMTSRIAIIVIFVVVHVSVDASVTFDTFTI